MLLPAPGSSTGGATLPAGTIVMHGVHSAPTGWLLCDGSAVSRTTYAALFAVVGTTYGAGDGSTTFNVPHFGSRSPVGSGVGSGLTARAPGATGGEETHTLTVAEMPSHRHDGSDENGNTANTVIAQNFTATGLNRPLVNTTGTRWGVGNAANAGGGGAHNTMPPFLAVAFLIKT